MAPGCFSALWSLRRRLARARSDEEVDLSALASTESTRLAAPADDADVCVATSLGIICPRSLPSPSSVDDPDPISAQDSLPSSASTAAPMMTGVESQSASSCSLPGCAGEVPMEFPSSRPAYCLDPVKAKQHVDRIRHFRILVMGRANAGKTTILQRVCNTMDEPEIVNREGWKLDANVVQASLAHGEHNIEDELIFRSHPQFIFHDSCGFEAGSEKQFDMMKKFVLDRARTPKLDERIHAIWFCVPLNESHRMITAAERKFFDECDTGHVPVILLSTKADSLELEVFEQLEDQGFDVDDATRAKEMEEEILSNYIVKLKNWLNNLEFPPHDYLSLSRMDEEDADCTALLACTANALSKEGLQELIISTQQSNLGLCIEFAIMKTLKKWMDKMAVKIIPALLTSMLSRWFPFKYFDLLEDENPYEFLVCGVMASGGEYLLTLHTATLLDMGL